MSILHLFPLLFLLSFSNVSCQQTTTNQTADRPVGPPWECSEAWQDGLPEVLSRQTTIGPEDEPGEPLEVSGIIYQNDGKTPAEGVILYLYHTDQEGNYSRGKGSGCARRHGLLRGWIQTGADGRYRFRTIRPASYPNSTVEQHIHATIKEPGLQAYWIDSYVFDDDPMLTPAQRNRMDARGGSGLVHPVRNSEGIWVAQRDIVLGKNVEGY